MKFVPKSKTILSLNFSQYVAFEWQIIHITHPYISASQFLLDLGQLDTPISWHAGITQGKTIIYDEVIKLSVVNQLYMQCTVETLLSFCIC